MVISSERFKKVMTLKIIMINVPTLIPPAVLKEPPPININTMVIKVDALVILLTSKLLKPDERGTVAWNHAFKAWSPTDIGANVKGLDASIAQITIKAKRFKPAIVDRINLLLVESFFQRLALLISINTTKPIPPMIYSILMVNVTIYWSEKLIKLLGNKENPPLLKAEIL